MSARTLATTLLPFAPGLRLDRLETGLEVITATLIATRPRSPCPICGCISRQLHSRYQRTLTDLPWGRFSVRVQLAVRKFFCREPTCLRRIFTERLPEVVAPYARRTTRLAEVLRLLGFALGGEAGARLVARLGMAVSPATLLRLVRRAALADRPTPGVLGVDDWAFRKGHRYGTILVDLEQRRIIELLPDRKAESLARWLDEHPGVQIITRDRAQVYAEGARQGAPQATQVADRWHLLKNLGEALERYLLHHRQAIKTAAALPVAESAPLPSYRDADQVPWQQRGETASRQKHAQRIEQYEQVHALHAAGVTKLEIAQTLAISRRTVYRYLGLASPPERRQPRRSRRRLLAPYEPYLLQRWQEGCHQRSRLVREIRAQGYLYGASNVYRFLKRVEREHGRAITGHAAPPAGVVPSARQVACLLVQRPDELTDEEREYLARLGELESTIATAYDLAQRFAVMARERRGDEQFQAWLAQVAVSGLGELSSFARGLQADQAAVAAGLRLPWSNGQTEGQVNKLKLVKRQMYGRAKFDLLRQRVLQAA